MIANITTTASEAETMTSREIAELTGKEHGHVCRDIRTMLEQIRGAQKNQKHTDLDSGSPEYDRGKRQQYKYLKPSTFDRINDHFSDDPDVDHVNDNGVTEEKDSRGYVSLYHLSKSYTFTLITGYRADLRLAIIKRWHDLESGAALPNPGNLSGVFQTPHPDRIAAILKSADLFPRMLDSMARLGKNKRDQATAANEIVQSITGMDFLALAGNPHLNLELFEDVPARRHATDQHKQLDKLLAYIANGARYKENHAMSCDLQHGKEIVHAKLLKLMHLKKETFADLIEQAIGQGLIARKNIPSYGGTIYVLVQGAAA